MTFVSMHARRLLLAAGGLLLPGAALAQDLVNTGTELYVGSGSTLYVPGGLRNQAGTLRNDGTVRVGGDAVNAGTLHLGLGAWQALGSFTSNGPVVAGSGQLSFVGSTDQTLAVAGATLPAVLLAQTGAGRLLVTQDATLGRGLVLTGGLVRTAPSATLTLPDGASLSGEAPGRYVQGNLRVRRTNVAGLVDFGHGVVLDASGQNLGAVAVTRTAGLHAAGTSYGSSLGGASGIDRIWTIEPDRAPTAPVPLTLSWLPDDDNGLSNFAQARVWTQAGPTAPWQAVGAPADASATRRLTSSSAALPGRFTVSNAANPLPVELLSFTAERREADARLSWETAQEVDNSHFEVEASADGRTFTAVATVAGRGTTTQRSSYQLTDRNIARYGAAVVYYRLRQVDRNGRTQTFPIRTVRVPLAAALAVQAWPNPFDASGLQLSIRSASTEAVTLTVRDVAGRTVLQRQVAELTPDNAHLRWPEAAALPPGVYVLLVSQGRQHTTLRIVRA